MLRDSSGLPFRYCHGVFFLHASGGSSPGSQYVAISNLCALDPFNIPIRRQSRVETIFEPHDHRHGSFCQSQIRWKIPIPIEILWFRVHEIRQSVLLLWARSTLRPKNRYYLDLRSVSSISLRRHHPQRDGDCFNCPSTIRRN